MNKIFNYNILTEKSSIYGINNKYFGESSLIYTKQFWKTRPFLNSCKEGEINYFLENRQQYCKSIPSQFITIALTHNKNLTTNLKLINKNNKEIKHSLFEQISKQTQFIISLIKKNIIQNS